MLEVKNLTIRFRSRKEPAVENLSFQLPEGGALGLVGESGSGKSATALCIAGLLDPAAAAVSGQILLDGIDLLTLPEKEKRTVRGSVIGMVFQEPAAAMDPLQRIGRQVEETLRLHGEKLSAAARRERALSALAEAELPDPEQIYGSYPHECSGGQLQRAMIAAAVVSRPKLLLLDEPTTALDVTVQAQILSLLKKLNETQGISMLLISHDLRVVRRLCPRVAVMQAGRIVERGETETVFASPSHPYTKRLIEAIPKPFYGGSK